MTKKRISVEISEIPTPEEKIRFDLANADNYETVIWRSIISYNHKAQLDVAKILYKIFKEKLLNDNELSNPLVKNLILRIVQLYQETLDHFALICLCIINKHKSPIFETYMETDNPTIRSYYKKCLMEEISDNEILDLWGLSNYKHLFIDDCNNQKLLVAKKNQIDITRRNLKVFGTMFSKYDLVTGKTEYTPFVKGTFSIKHAFKMLTPSKLARELWKIEDDKNPILFQEIKNIKVYGNNSEVPILTIGSMFKDNEGEVDKILKKIIKDIEFLSSNIKHIANIQLNLTNDQFYSLRSLIKVAKIKIKSNDTCFCGSKKKFKKCHISV